MARDNSHLKPIHRAPQQQQVDLNELREDMYMFNPDTATYFKVNYNEYLKSLNYQKRTTPSASQKKLYRRNPPSNQKETE